MKECRLAPKEEGESEVALTRGTTLYAFVILFHYCCLRSNCA